MESEMQEIWKQIPGHELCYEISNLGRVRSLERQVGNRWGTAVGKLIPAKIRVASKNAQGYHSVHMYAKQTMKKQYVHRLVASAFIPNPLDLPQVNHKDGDKANNQVSNLEWCDGSTNCQHAISEALYQNARGEQSFWAKLTEVDVSEIRRLASTGMFHREIAELYSVGRKAITKIVNRQRWAHVP
jgi:hypothetical protein